MAKDRANDPARRPSLGGDTHAYNDTEAQKLFAMRGYNKGIAKDMDLMKNAALADEATKYSSDPRSDSTAAARTRSKENVKNRESYEGYEGVRFGSKRGE